MLLCTHFTCCFFLFRHWYINLHYLQINLYFDFRKYTITIEGKCNPFIETFAVCSDFEFSIWFQNTTNETLKCLWNILLLKDFIVLMLWKISRFFFIAWMLFYEEHLFAIRSAKKHMSIQNLNDSRNIN